MTQILSLQDDDIRSLFHSISDEIVCGKRFLDTFTSGDIDQVIISHELGNCVFKMATFV